MFYKLINFIFKKDEKTKQKKEEWLKHSKEEDELIKRLTERKEK